MKLSVDFQSLFFWLSFCIHQYGHDLSALKIVSQLSFATATHLALPITALESLLPAYSHYSSKEAVPYDMCK